MTPHAYQIQTRLNRSKVLLARGVPIKQVAWLTGFTGQSHFGKYFRRAVGFTPKFYQRAVSGSSNDSYDRAQSDDCASLSDA